MTKIMKGGREYGSTPASASGVAYSNLVSGLVATNVQDAIDESYGVVTQTANTTSANYEVLFSGTADNTTRTEEVNKSSGFVYNPNTGSISLAGNATVRGKVISPHKSVPYINKDQVCGLLAQKDYNVTAWYPAVCLDTYGGGHWQVGNYTSEALQFVYGTKTNKDGDVNTTQIFNLRPYADNNAHTANVIIGSGTSGYIAKFNADNSITDGPAFGTSTTKCLAENGTWQTFGTSNLAIGTTASTAAAGNHAHGSITNAGAITGTTALASGDGIIFADSSDSSKLKRSSITIGTGTTKFLREDGSWQTPAYPTVNNATLTIQKNGTTVKTFTANASSNVTCNLSGLLETGGTNSQTFINGIYCDMAYNSKNLNSVSCATFGVVSGTSMTNAPDTAYWYVLCLPVNGNVKYMIQLAFRVTSNQVRIRYCNNGTWSSWTALHN